MLRNLFTLAFALLMATPALAQTTRERTERGAREDAPRGREARGEDPDMERDDRRPRGREEEEGDRRGGPGSFFRRPNPMFEALDADRDGSISTAELRKAAASLKKLDADSDGNITLEEASPTGGPGGFGDPNERIARMLEEYDANKDGKLSADEIPERMAPMLQNADADNDGFISKEELSASMEQMRGRFGGGNVGGPAGGVNPQAMIQQMARYDLDGDGKITAQEVPDQMRRMFQAAGADLNNDGGVDAAELKAMAERMGEQAGGRGFRPTDRFGRDGDARDGDARDSNDRGARRGRDNDEADEDADKDADDERPTSRTRRGNN